MNREQRERERKRKHAARAITCSQAYTTKSAATNSQLSMSMDTANTNTITLIHGKDLPQPVPYSPTVLASMVGNGNTEIPDDIIIAALNLLKSKCDNHLEPYIGYFTPAEIQYALNVNRNDSTAVIKNTLPDGKFSINIHPLPGHWVTSCYYPQTNEVHVYDSLMSAAHYEQVLPQLKFVYGERKTSNVIYSQVTQQHYEPLCGVMAVSFAFSCYLGKDPEFTDYDISTARQHLRQCLLQGEVKSFPERSGQFETSYNSNQLTNQPFQQEHLFTLFQVHGKDLPQPVPYSPTVLASMVGNGNTEIPDDIIIAALNLLKSKCDNHLEPYIGYFTPAEIQYALNVNRNDSTAVIKNTLPDGKFSINIHPLPGHWVTSCYYPQTNEVHVYDSLMSAAHYEQVLPQLKFVYGERKTSNVIYSQVTQQHYEPLCGVMAVSFAFSCYLGKDPEFTDYDISTARQHLRQCLLQGEVKSFPERSGQFETSYNSNQLTNQPFQQEHLFTLFQVHGKDLPQPVPYSPTVLASMVGNGNTEIPDDIIIAALNLLKSKCDNHLEPYIGYFTPAEIQYALNVNRNDSTAVIKNTLPDGKFSINIHPLPGHWVTSCYYPQTNEVHVYDSLMSAAHYEQVLPQLKFVYGERKTSNVIYSQVTQQHYEPLCGVMAVSFAFSCYLGKDPEFTYYDISTARQHLRQCLLQGEVKSFPEISGQLHSASESSMLSTNHSVNDTIRNLHRYFSDQTKRSTEHQIRNQTKQTKYEKQSASIIAKSSLAKKQKHFNQTAMARQQRQRNVLSKAETSKTNNKERLKKQLSRKSLTHLERNNRSQNQKEAGLVKEKMPHQFHRSLNKNIENQNSEYKDKVRRKSAKLSKSKKTTVLLKDNICRSSLTGVEHRNIVQMPTCPSIKQTIEYCETSDMCLSNDVKDLINTPDNNVKHCTHSRKTAYRNLKERERIAQIRTSETSMERAKRKQVDVIRKRRKRELSSERNRRNTQEREARRRQREASEVREHRNEREREAQRRKREASEVREHRNEREREAQRRKREASEVREHRNEREREAQRIKREASEVREHRNEREREAQRIKRVASEVREHRNEREREAQRRKREASEVREHRNEREREAQRRKREASEVREHRNEREREAQRIKREASEVREHRNEREREAQRIKRVASEVREHRNEREREAQRRKREASEVREHRNEREREAQRRKREASEVREHRNEREREAQRIKREASEVREHRNEREREAQRIKRVASEVREHRNEREREAQRRKREASEVREHRNEREGEAQRRKREASEVREHRNEREREAQRRKREASEVREHRNEREREAQRIKRVASEVREHRNEREREAQRRKREASEVREHRNEREREAQRRKREASDVRAHRNEQERKAMGKKRESSRERTRRNKNQLASRKDKFSDVEKSIFNFKKDIQNGPIYICTVCNRLLYLSSVKIYKDSDYVTNLNCRTYKISNNGTEYICMSCHNTLKTKTLPSLAVINGLEVDEIPHQIEELNSLEAVFVSRRIPFMKILALPRGKQKAVHGCVVNVPIEPEQLVSILPRVPSSETFITVRVKRKLMYRGHVFIQTIRPDKIRNALHILKNVLQNPLYEDVVLNETWIQDSCEQDQDLWDSLVTEPVTEDMVQPGDMYNDREDISADEQNDQEHNDNQVEDEQTRLSGLPFDSCIQPKDIIAEQKTILNIAPGEGKKPQSFISDKHAEELSFPQLFPRGRFGFSSDRPRKLSLKKYFQTRILNFDRRFARNIDYIFYAQYRTEAKEVSDSISISLRKGKQQNVTAGELKDKLADIVRNDLGIHFLQKIRGSPAYFNKLFYDLLGMIRQLGPCTWFITLSAADLKWPDTIKVIAKQKGIQLTDEDVSRLSWEEKCKYLRSDPVTAARHFDNRVQLFFKYILMNKQLNPLGEIADYKYRIEFQHRGSPHVHMLAWVNNAPNFENNEEHEIRDFIDSKVSCQLPEDDIMMYDLLHLVQRHSHSVACRKHGKSCRFNFPRPPVNETLVFKPLESTPNSHMQELYSTALTSVYEQLNNVDQKTSLEEVLNKANVSELLYIDALHWIKTKSGQPAIVLKRKPYEGNVNNYNKVLMKGWEANLDVQFVTNVYSCVMYLASYISKPEKTLGDVLKAVSTSSQHLGTKQTMKNIAHKFLTHREISAQEAVYRLLSLPLSRGSREVLFVNTDLPENRTRLFKPIAIIEIMDEDDPDVYQKGLLDRYSARPHSLDGMCLAELAANYRPVYRRSKKDNEEENDSVEIQDDQNITATIIKLRDGLGKMNKRRSPAIIRYHQTSMKKEPESYFHSQLLLYFPWRKETEDLLLGSYKATYESNYDTIQQNRQIYEHHTEELADMLEDIENNGFPDDNWVTVAPQTEQARGEEEIEGIQTVRNLQSAYDTEAVNTTTADAGFIPHEYVLSTEDVSNDEWINMIMSLNTLQYQLHQFIVHWSTNMALSHTGKRTQPFQIFLTGGAGVGKSFLVRTIVQTVKRLFARNNQVNDAHVLVCAPTGAAAYTIAGHTCHSAFHLPIRKSKDDDYIPLSTEKLAAMKEALGDTKLIVIDEVSMLSADMLLTIHRRLCDVMGCSEPFGGASILAVGDLMQLPAVAQRPVYQTPSDKIAAIYGSLWTSLFQIVELTEIQRQKGDKKFADLLNRVRVGEQTDDDIETLKSRQISKSSHDYPVDSIHMFTYNRLKNQHNDEMLTKLKGQHFTFRAVDSKKDEQTQRIQKLDFEKDAGGLQTELTVAIGARVVLMKNIDVSDGLVNSASGVVTGFIPAYKTDQDADSFRPKYILVKFDDDRVGKKCRSSSRGILPDQISTPIPTVETPVYLSRKSSKVTSKRAQFPLSLAWGVTIHKEQGKTEDSAVVSCTGNFFHGQFYTAISRTKDMAGLHFIDEVSAKKIKFNKESLNETNRMKKESPFSPYVPVFTNKSSDVYLKLQSFNINSLKPHMCCFLKENDVSNLHILCFQETWLLPDDSIPEFDNFSCIRTDSKSSYSGHRCGGLLMYIRQDMRVLKQYLFRDVNFEYQMVLLSYVRDYNMRLVVLSVYNNPRSSLRTFLADLEHLMQRIPGNIPTFLIGDFNIDVGKASRSTKDLLHLTQYYSFHQLVHRSTHRRGGILDLLFMNRDLVDSSLDIIPTYYSDHLIVSLAIPLRTI